MNRHTQFSRKRILTIAVTTLIISSNDIHTKNNEKSKQTNTRAISAPSTTDIATNINGFTGKTATQIVTAITGGDNLNLSDINAKIDDIENELETIVPELQAVVTDLTTAATDIEQAATSIEQAAVDLQASATELQALIGDLATSEQVAAVTTTLQGSNTSANLTDIEGDGFDAATDSLVAISHAIATISPTVDLTPIEGPLYTTANNSLAALAGTGSIIGGGSGSTNTFDPAINSLADICGDAFATADNSLVAISAAIAGISPITGFATYDQVNNLGTISDTSSVYADFQSLGAGGSDVSSISSQFDATNALINALPTDSDIALLATLANQELQATSAGLTSAVNDIEGSGFVANTNSLVNICGPSFTASKNSLSVISGGSSFAPATDSLHAIAVSGINSLATVNTNVTTLGTSALATAANLATTNTTVNTINTNVNTANSLLTAIEGTNFAGGTDSLHNISNNTISVPFATQASFNSFQTEVNTQFASVQNSLIALIAKTFGDPVKQVVSAKNAAFLTTPVTSTDTNEAAITLLTNYNTARFAALNACATATLAATQSYTATTNALDLVNTAIDAFNALATQWATEGTPEARPSSAYSAAQISAALILLNESLQNLQSNQAQAA